jgi:hypothetical protein
MNLWIGPRPHRPESDALIGTQVENVRHALVRVGFMNALLGDSRVQALFDMWSTATHPERVENARMELKAVEAEVNDFLQDPSVSARARRDLAAKLRAARRSFAWIVLSKRKGLAQPPDPDPVLFVRDTLGLPWAWVALELHDTFVWSMLVRSGLVPPIIKGVWVERSADAVEPVSPEVGESQETYAARLVARGRALGKAEPGMPAKRAPRKRQEPVRRWGEYFYRGKVRHPPESIRSLAKEFHRRKKHRQSVVECLDYDRKRVRAGIREAERLLGLVQYFVTPPEDQTPLG